MWQTTSFRHLRLAPIHLSEQMVANVNCSSNLEVHMHRSVDSMQHTTDHGVDRMGVKVYGYGLEWYDGRI